MRRQTKRPPLIAALGAAAQALKTGGQGAEVAEQIAAAARTAPAAGGPPARRGLLRRARPAPAAGVPMAGPGVGAGHPAPGMPAAGAAMPPVPAGAQPPASPNPAPDALAQAEAALNAATMSGSSDEIVGALLAYEQVERDTLAQHLLANGVDPAAVGRIVAERQAQAGQEHAAMLSQMQAMQHQTAMSTINNIR